MKAIKLCLTISCILAASFLAACGSDEEVAGIATSQQTSAMSYSRVWYQQIAMGVLDGNTSVVSDLNDKGQSVGTAYQRRLGTYRHAFLWQDGTMTDLGILLGTQSSAAAINNKGNIVGEADNHGFVLLNGIKTDLGTLGGDNSEAVAINNKNLIVGNSTMNDGSTHAFFWKKGTMIDLGTLGGATSTVKSINEDGQVLGESEDSNGNKRGFIWQNGKMKDLGTLGGNNTYPAYMNNNGQIVGSSDTAEGAVHAFLWQRGRMKDLGALHGNNSQASCINDNGQVVGYTEKDALYRPFIWEHNTMHELSGFTPTISVIPSFINEKERIIGLFKSRPSARAHAFIWEDGMLTDLGLLGYFTEAVKINKKDDIIGNGRHHVGGFGEAYIFIKNKSSPIEVLDVPADGTIVESTQDYPSSNVYRIDVTGTYEWGACDSQNCPGGAACDYVRFGDAQSLTDDCWASSFSTWNGYDISLYVNDQHVEWDDYQPSEHRYAASLNGTGGHFKFKINDCEGCYDDNDGSLKVRIYAMSQ